MTLIRMTLKIGTFLAQSLFSCIHSWSEMWPSLLQDWIHFFNPVNDQETWLLGDVFFVFLAFVSLCQLSCGFDLVQSWEVVAQDQLQAVRADVIDVVESLMQVDVLEWPLLSSTSVELKGMEVFTLTFCFFRWQSHHSQLNQNWVGRDGSCGT